MTYKDIFNRAYGYSVKIQPGQTATEDPELLELTWRSLQAIYAIASSEDPTFFGRSASVSDGSGVWAIPSDAELVFHVQRQSDGAEVVVLRIQEQDLEPDLPAVYVLGQELHAIADAQDPTGETLDIYYAGAPTPAPTSPTDNLPSDWDAKHDDLLIYQVALYLATKDIGSMDLEIPELRGMRSGALLRFVRRLRNRVASQRTRFESGVPTNSRTLEEHQELLQLAMREG